MEFNLLVRDIPIKVTCKFEMLIFKSAQVIKYYAMFAFLFVQTVFTFVTYYYFSKLIRKISPTHDLFEFVF